MQNSYFLHNYIISPKHTQYKQTCSCGSFSGFLQGFEGVPVSHGSEDPLHDQLEGSVSPVHRSADCALVPGGVDFGCVPEPRLGLGTDRRGLHPRGSPVQYVPAGPLGLHDGRR